MLKDQYRMGAPFVVWRRPQPKYPSKIHRRLLYQGGSSEGLGGVNSIGPGGKGSFQAVKLQRPARTTVCSHSTRDMAAMRSIESNHNDDETQNKCLSSCEQL